MKLKLIGVEKRLNKKEAKGRFVLISTGIILIIIGISMMIKPSLLWLITESWKSNDATEPSSLYIWSTRFGGVMVTLAGIGGVLAFFLY